MAKRTYNRRGRTTAKKPVTSDKRRAQRVKGAETSHTLSLNTEFAPSNLLPKL